MESKLEATNLQQMMNGRSVRYTILVSKRHSIKDRKMRKKYVQTLAARQLELEQLKGGDDTDEIIEILDDDQEIELMMERHRKYHPRKYVNLEQPPSKIYYDKIEGVAVDPSISGDKDTPDDEDERNKLVIDCVRESVIQHADMRQTEVPSRVPPITPPTEPASIEKQQPSTEECRPPPPENRRLYDILSSWRKYSPAAYKAPIPKPLRAMRHKPYISEGGLQLYATLAPSTVNPGSLLPPVTSEMPKEVQFEPPHPQPMTMTEHLPVMAPQPNGGIGQMSTERRSAFTSLPSDWRPVQTVPPLKPMPLSPYTTLPSATRDTYNDSSSPAYQDWYSSIPPYYPHLLPNGVSIPALATYADNSNISSSNSNSSSNCSSSSSSSSNSSSNSNASKYYSDGSTYPPPQFGFAKCEPTYNTQQPLDFSKSSTSSTPARISYRPMVEHSSMHPAARGQVMPPPPPPPPRAMPPSTVSRPMPISLSRPPPHILPHHTTTTTVHPPLTTTTPVQHHHPHPGLTTYPHPPTPSVAAQFSRKPPTNVPPSVDPSILTTVARPPGAPSVHHNPVPAATLPPPPPKRRGPTPQRSLSPTVLQQRMRREIKLFLQHRREEIIASLRFFSMGRYGLTGLLKEMKRHNVTYQDFLQVAFALIRKCGLPGFTTMPPSELDYRWKSTPQDFYDYFEKNENCTQKFVTENFDFFVLIVENLLNQYRDPLEYFLIAYVIGRADGKQ